MGTMNWFDYLTDITKLDRDLPKLSDNFKLRLMKEFVYEAISSEKKRENINESNEQCIEQLEKTQILYTLAMKILADIQFNINLIHNWNMPLCLVGNLLRYFLNFSTKLQNFNPLQEVDWSGWTGVSRFAQVLYAFWTLLEGLDRVLVKPFNRCLTPPLPGLTEVPDVVFFNDNILEEQSIIKRLENTAQLLSSILETDKIVFQIPTADSFIIPDLDRCSFDEVNNKQIEATDIPTESMLANIYYFLGRHCFQRKEFDKAYSLFLSSKAAYNPSFNNLYFVGLTMKLLDSYLCLCKKLSRSQPSRFQSPWEIIEEQIESKQWNINQLTDILMNDLYRRYDCSIRDVLKGTIPAKDMSSLSINLREKLEREIFSQMGQISRCEALKISICNLLERVVCGQAVLTPLTVNLAKLDNKLEIKTLLEYLLSMLQNLWKILVEASDNNNNSHFASSRSKSCPNILREDFIKIPSDPNSDPFADGFNVEIENLRCFVLFLVKTLPIDYQFTNLISSNSLIMSYLSEEDHQEINSILNYNLEDLSNDLEIINLEEVEDNWFSIHDDNDIFSFLQGTNHAAQNTDTLTEHEAQLSNINPNTTDKLRLLSSYDGEEIKDILIRLHTNGICDRYSIVNLTPHWKLSAALTEELKSLTTEFDYVYTYILLCKAKILRDDKFWDIARLLYDTAKLKINQTKIQKLINHEITCCDFLKFLYLHNDLVPKSSSASDRQDLSNRSKACLTSYNLEQISTGSCPEQQQLMHICAICILLTINEHDHLLKLPNNQSPTLQLAQLLVLLSRDFAKLTATTKFVKNAKDLFDLLLKIFINHSSASVSSNNSNHSYMTIDQLRLFIQLLGNRGLLDLVICGLVSILTCVRSDINLSKPLYPKDIWPTTISSNFNAGSLSEVCGSLSDLVCMSLDLALSRNPLHNEWLLVKADIAMAEGNYHAAAQSYLESAAVDTNFFTKWPTSLPAAPTNSTILDIFSEWALQQLARCLREINRPELSLLIGEQNPRSKDTVESGRHMDYSYTMCDTADMYKHLVYDSTLLEVLCGKDADLGATERHDNNIKLFNDPDSNVNNSAESVKEIRQIKILDLLRTAFMQITMQ